MKSSIEFLQCPVCKEMFDHRKIQTFCKKCGEPLIAVYDYGKIRKHLRRGDVSGRVASMWRYFEFLPVEDERNVITLGEGWTPMIKLENFGRKLGLKNLYVKDESFNPTHSFKARGMSCAISKVKELNIPKVAIPTAGNAGGAISAYCAKAGIDCVVSAPKDTPKAMLKEAELYGAKIHLVDGLISNAVKFVQSQTDYFDVSTLKEPYRLQGKKTLGFEIVEQLGWKVPDWIIYPTGGGTGLIGIWLAVDELVKVGWVDEKFPRMVAVQSSGCSPIVKAFKEKRERTEFFENADTIAYGLRVPKPFADRLILEILYKSEGLAVEVDDSEIIAKIKELAQLEGIIFCPEGSATAVAVEKLVKNGYIRESETVVIFNTASGLKYF